jgi:hypothetical protein
MFMRHLVTALWAALFCVLSGCQTSPSIINYHYKVVPDSVPDGAVVTILQSKVGFDAFDSDTTSVLVDYSKLSVSHFHFTGNPPSATDPLVLDWNAIGSEAAIDTTLPNVVTAMRVDASPNLPMGQFAALGQAFLSVRFADGRAGRFVADGGNGTYFEIRLDQADLGSGRKRIGCVVNCFAKRDPADGDIRPGDAARIVVLENVYLVDHD